MQRTRWVRISAGGEENRGPRRSKPSPELVAVSTLIGRFTVSQLLAMMGIRGRLRTCLGASWTLQDENPPLNYVH